MVIRGFGFHEQGNIVLTKEHHEEVVLSPSGFKPFTLEATLEGGFLLEQVEGDLAQDGHNPRPSRPRPSPAARPRRV